MKKSLLLCLIIFMLFAVGCTHNSNPNDSGTSQSNTEQGSSDLDGSSGTEQDSTEDTSSSDSDDGSSTEQDSSEETSSPDEDSSSSAGGVFDGPYTDNH